jgi:hypothetical protein
MSDIEFKINHRSNNLLKCNLIWNNELPIDRNIRKSIGKIEQFQRFEHHLSHKQLNGIRKAHCKEAINWLWTNMWMKYNPYDRPTSLKLQHRYSWNLKNSTFNLPVLDILNHNFPSIIKDRTDCLLCNSSVETNNHLWRYSVTLNLLYNIFRKHQLILIQLLEAQATKFRLMVNDTVKYSRLFKWAY